MNPAEHSVIEHYETPAGLLKHQLEVLRQIPLTTLTPTTQGYVMEAIALSRICLDLCQRSYRPIEVRRGGSIVAGHRW